MTDLSNAGEKPKGSVPEWVWSDVELPFTAKYLLPKIHAMLPEDLSGKRLLDVGCGNGAFTKVFADLGCNVVGVDASESGIARAREHVGSGRFEQMEVTSSILDDLGEEPFDFVLSTEVVEHLYAPRIWAAACFNALRPGGDLVLSTPYHGFCKNLMLSIFNAWDSHHQPLKDGGHIKFWSVPLLKRLLEEPGFHEFTWAGAGRGPYVWKSFVARARRPVTDSSDAISHGTNADLSSSTPS